MAPADDRRGRERPGSDPADHERPIRASQRARLRGLDGVRRDDVYGSAPQGSGPQPGADVPQGSGPLPGFGTPQGSGPLPGTAPRPDSGTQPAGPPGNHDASGTVPSHARAAAAAPPPLFPSAGDETTQAFPSRRARREAQQSPQQQSPEPPQGSQPQSRRAQDRAQEADSSLFGDAGSARHARRGRRESSSAPVPPGRTFAEAGHGSASAAAAGGAAAAGAAGGAAAGIAGSTAARGDAPTRSRRSASAASEEQATPASGEQATPSRIRARDRSRGDSRDRSRDASGVAARTDSDSALIAEAEAAAPRHSRREGDAFPTIVRWTTLGTLLPGLGMIRGRSKLGWVLFLGYIAVIVAIIAWVVWRTPLKAVARVAGSPTILYTIAVVLLVGILIWAFTILRSYSVLKRGKRLTDIQKWLGWGLVGSLLLCVGIPLGVGAAYTKVQGDTVIQVFGRDGQQGVDLETLWEGTDRINAFLIGRDSGDGREGTRPDTMLVASIKPATGDTTLISVPRNLNRAQFPEGSALAERFPYGFDGFGPEESMINAVWTWAEEHPDEVGDVPENLDTGMEATMQAVEGSLGLSLDYYASVDMQGFEDVVNAIGGVEIDVERPIPMGGGTNLNTGLKNPISGWIDPGPQTLTGKQALWYVRSRDGSDNYDRMCRQQRMLKLTIDQVDPQELAIAYPKLAGSAGRNILTDIPQSQVGAFVELAAAMQGAEIKSAQITNDVTSTMNPDYDELHAWIDEQLDPAEPSQAEEQADDAPAEDTEEQTDEAPADETAPTEEPTEEPKSGIEDEEGKCYPTGYEPGSGWPGWPGQAEAGQTEG